jgi:ATP-dependent Clp endopeptidase proteolytic subunit ClpP
MSARTWFRAAAGKKGKPPRVDIYDEIGAYGVTARDFIGAIRGFGDVTALDLHINSPGGSVFDALAIHSVLARHPATVTVYVDGLAASAASVIAMVGDHVVMPAGSMLMIHDPIGGVVGGADDMRGMAEALDRITDSLASTYAAKSGKPMDAVKTLMAAETWLSAAEAVEMGFADQIEAPRKIAAMFDLSKYAAPPQALHLPANRKEADMADDTVPTAPPPSTDTPPEASSAPAAPPPRAPIAPAPAAAAVPPPANPADVVAYCVANGCAALAEALIRDNATMTVVEARVGAAGTIKSMVADASKITSAITAKAADEYITAGLCVEDVRAKLWDRVVKAQSPEIRGSIAADTGADTTEAALNKAVAKVNARIEGNTQPKEG